MVLTIIRHYADGPLFPVPEAHANQGEQIVRAIIVMAILAALPAVAAESYVCVPDEIVVLRYDGEKWRAASIYFPELKFIVRKATVSDRLGVGYDWAFEVLPGGNFVGACEFSYGKGKLLLCAGPWTEFYLNDETLRFQFVNVYGYVDRDPKDDVDDEARPALGVGVCIENDDPKLD